jgi:hypothetical protein
MPRAKAAIAAKAWIWMAGEALRSGCNDMRLISPR